MRLATACVSKIIHKFSKSSAFWKQRLKKIGEKLLIVGLTLLFVIQMRLFIFSLSLLFFLPLSCLSALPSVPLIIQKKKKNSPTYKKTENIYFDSQTFPSVSIPQLSFTVNVDFHIAFISSYPPPLHFLYFFFFELLAFQWYFPRHISAR